jgi:hypothetical protein
MLRIIRASRSRTAGFFFQTRVRNNSEIVPESPPKGTTWNVPAWIGCPKGAPFQVKRSKVKIKEVAVNIEQHSGAVPGFGMERSWNDFWNGSRFLPFHTSASTFQTTV